MHIFDSCSPYFIPIPVYLKDAFAHIESLFMKKNGECYKIQSTRSQQSFTAAVHSGLTQGRSLAHFFESHVNIGQLILPS
jgi:hypothetical protein